jgi:hypothetical protein
MESHKEWLFHDPVYVSTIKQGVLPKNTLLRKLRVPLKIKIFLWYLIKGVTLTKDNLAKRNWQADIKCFFCSAVETIQHLFFDCYFARFVWNALHTTFGIQAPASLICLVLG